MQLLIYAKSNVNRLVTVHTNTQQSTTPLQYNERDGVSNQKIRVTGLCAGNSPVTCEFPAQRAS